MAGRSHPSGGPTWPLNGRSIVLVNLKMEEVLLWTTGVVGVVLRLVSGWRPVTPRCVPFELIRLLDGASSKTIKALVVGPDKERMAREG